MHIFYDGDHLEDDLARMPDGDLIDAFLTGVSTSDDAIRELTKWPGENANPFFNAKGVQTLQQQGYNIYRIRPLSRRLRKYRILFAYDKQHDDFYVLAIAMKRPAALSPENLPDDFYNYEHNHPITKRICRECDILKIPRIS